MVYVHMILYDGQDVSKSNRLGYRQSDRTCSSTVSMIFDTTLPQVIEVYR